jgi:hypothetical protein
MRRRSKRPRRHQEAAAGQPSSRRRRRRRPRSPHIDPATGFRRRPPTLQETLTAAAEPPPPARNHRRRRVRAGDPFHLLHANIISRRLAAGGGASARAEARPTLHSSFSPTLCFQATPPRARNMLRAVAAQAAPRASAPLRPGSRRCGAARPAAAAAAAGGRLPQSRAPARRRALAAWSLNLGWFDEPISDTQPAAAVRRPLSKFLAAWVGGA